MQDLPQSSAPSVGSADVDAEHRVQLGLIDAAIAALQDHDEEAGDVIDQLCGYTEVHFLSEQLLMRRAAGSDYAPHEQEHARLLGDLQDVRTSYRNGDEASALGQLRGHRQHIEEHIRSWDRAAGRADAEN